MENKAHALAAGIFVVLVTALLLVLGAWLTRDTGVREPYEISTRESVSGLQAQAAVRYRGVDVGKVDSISFDPKAQGNVLIHFAVDRNAPMTKSTFATLAYQGVTGLAYLELDDSGQPGAPLAREDGHPPRIPLKPGLLQKLADRGEKLLDQADQAIGRVNKLLGDDNQKKFSAALYNIGQAAAKSVVLVL